MPLIALNVALFLWAMTALFAKLIPMPADVLIWFRSVVGILGFAPVLWLFGKPPKLKGKQIGIALTLGLLMTGHWVSFFHSAQVSTVGLAILALYSYPIFTILLEPLFSGERVKLLDIGLGLLVTVGLYIMLPSFEWSDQAVQGIFWGVVSALLFSLRNILSRYKARQIDSLTQMFYQVLVASLVLIPIALPKTELDNLDRIDWLQLLALAWIFVLVPHTLFVFSLKSLMTKTVSLIATIQPVYGVFFAWLILSEIPAVNTLLGGFLILSVALIEALRIRNSH